MPVSPEKIKVVGTKGYRLIGKDLIDPIRKSALAFYPGFKLFLRLLEISPGDGRKRLIICLKF
jgi:hypothetical protein